MEWIFLLTGLILGGIIGWLLKKPAAVESTVESDYKQLQSRFEEASKELGKYLGENQVLLRNNNELMAQVDRFNKEMGETLSLLAAEKGKSDNLQQKLLDQKEELENLNKKFTLEFENLANRILDEKSKKFSEQNQTSLDQILTPLKDRIKDFEEKVQKHYDEESREKASLKQQITMLHDLNQVMSKEAQNLTRALKGDSKTQGNWGEFILESILEKSGLVKDREYLVQASMTNEEGKRYQPDVLVMLPDNKVLIIDSKVSLTAYEKYVSADDDVIRQQAIKEHLLSFRSHIKGLSDKKYQQLPGQANLDFVLLFVPIEPAFALAVQQEAQLFNDAFDRNIVIVSPSTLLATLRTVANIWKQEKQTRNAIDIANRAGELYDKFNGFIDDMIDLGKRMDASKSTYENAMKRLHTGRGNVIKQIEDLKKMGANASKQLPAALIERANEDEV